METETKRADGSLVMTHHDYYETCVVCSDDVSMPAEIRKYAPPKHPILQDDTVAFVVAKLNVPTATGPGSSGTVLIEAWHVAPMPRDPTSDDYNAGMPDFFRPLVLGLGVVAAGHDGLAGGAVTFPVTVFDYVQGGMKEMTVRYVSVVYAS